MTPNEFLRLLRDAKHGQFIVYHIGATGAGMSASARAGLFPAVRGAYRLGLCHPAQRRCGNDGLYEYGAVRTSQHIPDGTTVAKLVALAKQRDAEVAA